MADIRAGKGVGAAVKPEERKATLPLGGDKWGRDVLKKTIKGSETSIFVGLAAAAVATFLGTLFGALAGYYGKWVDDFFNWFYSVFSSIPYLLLILAVAAVLQQKGMLTIILILGLTGWTGVFRLIRAEYLKHKSREYVQAADAIGASNARRMFMPHLPERLARRARAAVDPRRRVHQVRSDPVVPRLRRSGRCRVVGLDAERGAERADPRQMVAARRRRHGDGAAGHRVLAVHRRAARRARPEAQGTARSMMRDRSVRTGDAASSQRSMRRAHEQRLRVHRRSARQRAQSARLLPPRPRTRRSRR